MVRVGIIGSENSHAMAFSQIMNKSSQYPDLCVVAIYGEDAEASRKVQEACEVPLLAQSAQAMLGQVDAVMVTSRDGALHPGYARPFLEAGIPAFIDKPIAGDGASAWALLRLAQARGVPVMGGSSVKFTADTLALRAEAQSLLSAGNLLGGHVWAPVSMENEYGGFYFYASHLVETALTVFGYDPLSVRALRKPRGVEAMLDYAGFTIHLSFLESVYHYGATVLGTQGAVTRPISLDGCYDVEVAHFAEMLQTGAMPQSIEEMALPIFVMDALKQAYETGEAQAIERPA